MNPIGMDQGQQGHRPRVLLEAPAGQARRAIEAAEARWESEHSEDAELLVVAFGTVARFARYVVAGAAGRGREGRLLPADHALALSVARPWPQAAEGTARVAVLEQNAGQMIDDVRLCDPRAPRR